MSGSPILSAHALSGLHWPTFDPFLFCAHHDDAFPPGDARMGPAASLEGRAIGQDFEGKDGWRMYHGDIVPGFPRHPHRGFETVTLARRGHIDHSDSLGATARFGQGDAQWMTAGAGIVHAEMMPLLDREGPNHAEFFQLWLNLPRARKLAPPHFELFWAAAIPTHRFESPGGGAVEITTLAGALEGCRPPSPPPHSWAAEAESDVAIWTIRMSPGSRWSLPRGASGSNRTLYFFAGADLEVAGRRLPAHALLRLAPEPEIELRAAGACELLLLRGRPIAEPVAQYGPFVMNRPEEIQQAMRDYRRTEFGGWPWSSDAPVHPREAGRFAIHADGRRERPPAAADPPDPRGRVAG